MPQDDALTSEFAQFLTWNPRSAVVLLQQHVNDGRGRCRCCSAGPQGGRVPWPCRLATLTTTASAIAAVRRAAARRAAAKGVAA